MLYMLFVETDLIQIVFPHSTEVVCNDAKI